MDVLNALVLILGGILGLSQIIAVRRPDLKPQVDKLVPFSATIGVALVAFALINLLRDLKMLLHVFDVSQVFAGAIWGMLGSSLLLGILFGMPQIANWIPPSSPAKQKALDTAAGLAPFQALIGLIGIVAAVLYLLFRFGVISMTGLFG
jgi:hypothetical protein